MRTDPDGMRHHAWAVAMGGVMPMLLRMDIAATPVEILHQCRFLQEFFEATDFYALSPHDELKHDGTRYVLADPGRSYIAYADDLSGKMGIRNLGAGEFAVTLDGLPDGPDRRSDSRDLRGRGPIVRQAAGDRPGMRGVDPAHGCRRASFGADSAIRRRNACERVCARQVVHRMTRPS